MVTGPNSTENTCPFQEEGMVAQQGKIASKGDQAPARKTPNPIFQCLIFRADNEIIWIPTGLSSIAF